ncbi:AMP-binding protein [Corynebacterium sp. TAE3-ERU12]|uniref:long-chain-fatty-acid--CoA ligase n=1 Tax=Corynebacterium sp. TAE3-ERU12 TaxID=2849491 RepID=UPI001C46BAE3|nr:long-chain-fatty-acid--CoA ligase [Corynebacterium sp. TAE3-ERU12]MBV7294528.1 AMP-binding protein [Corynebacterium sp. TAE3-ERU12]
MTQSDHVWLQHYPEWTDAHLDYGDTTLTEVYHNAITTWPDRPMLTFFGRSRTYAEADALVRRAAVKLHELGVRQGDRVALLMPNCPQHVVAYFAVLSLGATVVEHNPLYTAHELQGPFQDHAATIAICWDKITPVLDELVEKTPLETVIPVNIIDDMPWKLRMALRLPIGKLKETREKLGTPDTRTRPDLFGGVLAPSDAPQMPTPPRPISADDPAVIMYTSGTTGEPKGVELTHRNLVANLMQGKAWVPKLGERREVALAALPMFHAYGLTIVTNVSVFVGAELVMVPAPEMDLIMKVLKHNRPTWVPGVPTLYEKIIEEAEARKDSLKGIRFAFCGASSLPVRTVEKWEKLTGGKLVEGYGLTETSPIVVGNPMDGSRRPGYVGIPFPDTEVKIVDPDDPNKDLGFDTEGELVVRGPQVFNGYLNRPDETKKSFTDDGFYRTGDIGVMESDGWIRLVSRLKEIIITGGFNVYPAEVEEVLTDHDDILDAAVVGLEKSDGSELVCAAITLDGGARLDTEDYREHCRKNLTRYKVPRAFFHLDELPRDQMGKVRRRDVKDVLLKRLENKNKSVDDLVR